MPSQKRTIFLVCLFLTVGIASAMISLRAQNKSKPLSQEEQIALFASQFPIVEYTAPEPDNPEERAKRQAVSKKYDDEVSPINEYSTTITFITHWAVGLPALPVDRSQAIVIGQILDAQAHLSNDKTAVYSEFKVRVDEILKAERGTSLEPKSSLIAERKGGRVRFPSGHIILSVVNGQGMPLVGRRYVLFLTRAEEEINFNIVTGYELQLGRVALLDNPSQHPITAYKGANETTFLNELLAAIAKPSQPPLNQNR